MNPLRERVRARGMQLAQMSREDEAYLSAVVESTRKNGEFWKLRVGGGTWAENTERARALEEREELRREIQVRNRRDRGIAWQVTLQRLLDAYADDLEHGSTHAETALLPLQALSVPEEYRRLLLEVTQNLGLEAGLETVGNLVSRESEQSSERSTLRT